MKTNETEAKSLSPTALRTDSLDSHPLTSAVAGGISIDIVYGLRQAGGDKAFYQELLHDFAEQYCNVCTEIEMAIVNHNQQDAQRLLHGFTGVVGSLGMKNLFQIARELTTLLHQEQPWQHGLERLSVEMDQVIRSIANFDSFSESGKEGSDDA